jgi:hypothetical protein
MKKLVLNGLAVAVMLFIAKAQAFGCDCVVRYDSTKAEVAAWVKESATVFSGKVVKILPDPKNFGLMVAFATQEVWKGAASPTIEVIDPASGCGHDFRVGETYLVYASDYSKILTATACAGTGRRADRSATEQVKILGKARSPEKQKSARTRPN